MQKFITLMLMAALCAFNFHKHDTLGSPGPLVDTAVLTRGPYLQMGNQTSVTLRWRTNIPTDSKIEVGTAFGTYSLKVIDTTRTKEHELRITGLVIDTKYFYRFGSSTQILQNSSSNYFRTAPKSTTTRKIRIAVFGDCGRNDNNYRTGSLNAYLNYVGSNPAEVMLLLGDNAYNSGTDSEYQTQFFNTYSSSILKNHVLFPTPGNHDYYTTTQADRTAPYFKNFTVPTNGEGGGVPSGTKAYYSFNWGNIHFISLDSYGTEASGKRLYDTTSPQVVWVKKDLAANTRKWIVAFWHHPPYTKGNHNSDTEDELIRIRQYFIQIMERYGVDMVLCGHSHDYERSYLLNKYYGTESEFSIFNHTKSASSGKYDGTNNSCPYLTTAGPGYKGVVYVVSGSAGANGSIQLGYPHNALPFAYNDGGMFYFEVQDNRLDAKFLRRDGIVADKFTIMHNVNNTKNITVQRGSSVKLTASWIGYYRWNTGVKTRSITITPAKDTTYKVTDERGCITDVFKISLAPAWSVRSINKETLAPVYQIIPNIVKRGQSITIRSETNEFLELIIVDNNGRTVQSFRQSGVISIATGNLPAGTYFLQLKGSNQIPEQRFIVTD